MNRPHRKLQRLKNYDYSQNGYYFITVCTQNHLHLFGSIENGVSMLNIFGCTVEKHIFEMNTLYENTAVDKYVVMPNHIHMIIAICRERIACVPQRDPTKSQIPKMIQSFKSSVTKEMHRVQGAHTMRSLQQQQIWQKSYHDHIIRDEQEYRKIWEYIDTNPLKWTKDCYYTR